jgi:hypothetical protein
MLKKHKVDSECRNFQERWTENYHFIEYESKPVCLTYFDTVFVFKECNLKQHYNINMLKNMKLYRGR